MRDKHPVYGEVLRKFSTDEIIVWESVYPADLRIPLHTHDEHAYLNLVLTGGYWETNRNRQQECAAFDLAFHPPGAAHSNQFFSQETRLFHIRIEASAFSRLRAADKISPRSRYLTSNCNSTIRLYQEFVSRGKVSSAAVETALAEALRPAEVVPEPSDQHRWLESVIKLLHARFSQPLTLETIAEAAGVHKVHLCRVFRDKFDCTVGEYLRFLRVEQACRELSTTSTPLSIIAQDCGFSDQAHLSRALRQFTALTPLAYRSVFSR